MSSSAEKSVAELRRESEENRVKLASTVAELRGRMGETATELKTLVSPAHIKQEIRNYVQQERESIAQSVRRKVQENPLGAAAVGAAIAYPALGLLRSVPAPLWLIGAGLFLTSERGRQTAATAKDKIEDTVQRGAQTLGQAADTMQSRLGDHVEHARASLNEVGRFAATTAETLTDQARAAYHDARDALSEATSQVTTRAAEQISNQTDHMTTGMTGAGQQLASTVSEAADAVKANARRASVQTRSALESLIQERPLIVAGLGAAVGIFLAASIPPTEAENRLFGAGREKLKRQARQAANRGLEKAGELATDAIAATAAAAAREGLDASGIRNAVEAVGDKVGSVLDRGLDTALNKPQASSFNSNHTDNARN